MVNADLLLMITSTDGLYNMDPSIEGAEKIDKVSFGNRLDEVCLEGKTQVGTGGMESKVHAINKITPLGIKAIISSKDSERMILDPLTKDVGTFFSPKNSFDPEERKAWLISTKKPKCYIEVDNGAYNALLKSKSLLPKGVIRVVGEFYKGDCIEIRCKGKAFATGVCEYTHCEIEQIKGIHSDDIESILGFRTSCEIIHTINLVLEKDINNERAS